MEHEGQVKKPSRFREDDLHSRKTVRDAAFESEEILVILSRMMMSDSPTKGSDDKFFTLTS